MATTIACCTGLIRTSRMFPIVAQLREPVRLREFAPGRPLDYFDDASVRGSRTLEEAQLDRQEPPPPESLAWLALGPHDSLSAGG